MKPFDKAIGALLIALILIRVNGGIVAPTVSGPARVVIVQETGERMPPAQKDMLVEIQTGKGPVASYLKSRLHSVQVLDDDAKDENGQSVVSGGWIEGVRLPAVVILGAKTGQVLHRGQLPATPDELLGWLKGNGL